MPPVMEASCSHPHSPVMAAAATTMQICGMSSRTQLITPKIRIRCLATVLIGAEKHSSPRIREEMSWKTPALAAESKVIAAVVLVLLESHAASRGSDASSVLRKWTYI